MPDRDAAACRPGGDPPRFSLVDDASVIRAAASVLLPADSLVSTHCSVEDLLAASPQADVIVVDLHLTNTDQPHVRQGLAALTAVVSAGYTACVYTQEERRFVLAACLAAGALGVVSKSLPLDAARSAFLDVAAGELVAPPSVVGVVEVLSRRGHFTLLTPRQREVVSGRARGLTYAELARSMYVSPSTLRGYWREITDIVSEHLDQLAPGDIEHAFGLRPGDLMDTWPTWAEGAD